MMFRVLQSTLIVWILSQVSLSAVSANCNKRLEYLFTFKDKSFINHTFKTVPCKQEMECPLYCHDDDRCISYSFDEERHFCNLSDSDHTIHPDDLVNTPNAVYRSVKHNCRCTKNTMTCNIDFVGGTHQCVCKPGFTGKECEIDINDCVTTPCQNGGSCTDKVNGYNCTCAIGYQGKNCETTVVFSSCKEVFEKYRSAKSGVYHIKTDPTTTKVYCYMEDLPGCGGGGWTTIMKTDGNKDTFAFSSALWTDKNPYNVINGQSGADYQETKLPTYWTLTFDNLCLGMSTADQGGPRWILLKYKASSLYSVIADSKYRSFSLGRSTWKSLVTNSSLQLYCDQEGFNSIPTSQYHSRVRIGIISNDANICDTPDSLIGFGCRGYVCQVTTGNCGWSDGDNGNTKIATHGIILGQ